MLFGRDITDAQIIEKTLCTFHATNLVLVQQYRETGYETHSELITVLLVAKKHNEFLMKNRYARPIGTHGAPKAHIVQIRIDNGGKGRGHGEKKASHLLLK